MTPYIIKSNGEVVDYPPANGTDFTLQEMQAAVGGFVGAVRINPLMTMLVNEDGYAMELPLNKRATRLTILKQGAIVGDVLICNPKHIK